MPDLKDILGRYWLPQLVVFGTLLTYSLLLTTGVTLLVADPDRFFPHLGSNDNQTNDSFQVVLLFESKVSDKPITWDPIIVKFSNTTTLFAVMNSSLTISGKYHGDLGFFVEGINGLKQTTSSFWLYEYYDFDDGWVETPVGISLFRISSNKHFRWIYQTV